MPPNVSFSVSGCLCCSIGNAVIRRGEQEAWVDHIRLGMTACEEKERMGVVLRRTSHYS